jgi:hypothetical protein
MEMYGSGRMTHNRKVEREAVNLTQNAGVAEVL